MKMRLKSKAVILSILVLTALTSTLVYAEVDTINITVNNEAVQFNNEMGYPFLDENNRTQVPLRIILEKFGAEIGWENETKTAIVSKNDIEVRVPIGESYILKNDIKVMNDTSSLIKDERTYLPIRVVIEALNGKVEWISESKTVALYTNEFVSEEIPPTDPMEIIAGAGYSTENWKSESVYDEVPVGEINPLGATSVGDMNYTVTGTIFDTNAIIFYVDGFPAEAFNDLNRMIEGRFGAEGRVVVEYMAQKKIPTYENPANKEFTIDGYEVVVGFTYNKASFTVEYKK